MQYILASQVVLRGYRDMTYAVYFRGCGNAQKIVAEEYDILKNMYIPCSDEIFDSRIKTKKRLLRLGYIKEYQNQDTVQEYQKYFYCDNYYIPSVNWAITGKCNYNCLHCFNASDNNLINDQFSLKGAFNLIDELYKCGIMNVSITGGEPTLHPNFIQIIRYIEKKGLYLAEITTNGSHITQDLLDELSRFLKKPLFKVSFDGLGCHDWLRNKNGAQKDVIEKIRLLIKNNFNIQIQTNIHKKNIDSIIKTAGFFDTLGVTSMRIIRTSESPRWQKNGKGLSLTDDEYYDFSLKFIDEYINFANKMLVHIWQVITVNPLIKSYNHSNIKINPADFNNKLPVCVPNKEMAAITPSGEVVPCNQMSGWLKKHNISFGNVNASSLKDILTDSNYMNVVNWPVGEVIKNNPNICGKCKYRKVCMSGCRAFAILLGDREKKQTAYTQDEMPRYYFNYDPTKCLFFKKYKIEFDKLFSKKKWHCDNDYI